MSSSLAFASQSLDRALSRCAETAQTKNGFRIELDSKKFRAGNDVQLKDIGSVLSRFPKNRVSIQVYSGSEPIKDAEKIRDVLIEKGVAPERISLSGLIVPNQIVEDQIGEDQDFRVPTTMWLEIQSAS